MKTLLYNPIFINPQAYIVFPNLCGGLKQEIDSVIEPAIFDGKIEVKTIANGDIKLVRYYSNQLSLEILLTRQRDLMLLVIKSLDSLWRIGDKELPKIYPTKYYKQVKIKYNFVMIKW